jgi:NADH-quinone oxidoreductase subunit K
MQLIIENLINSNLQVCRNYQLSIIHYQLKGMPINYYIFLAVALFCIGVAGVLTRRNAIIVFMCIELMLNAVNLLLVAFSKMHHLAMAKVDVNAGINGQIFVFFIMVVAAAEVSVGLAIIVMMYRNTHSVDVNFLNRLKH